VVLATVVGMFIEVAMVKIVNRTRGWYERGATPAASPLSENSYRSDLR